ncbi:cyclic nucleotide-binding-like protein [Thamnocephalis sphaerospora]|uniref:cAMP-dependent protein kinase regulatory subunit n=1 Tax=Thamnocephalis sphaerospora TaxID=78915 RepID=A0A4P9XXD4_9FUNG|nr:cyclic nucleotide-binding-like protein [Thamnocephalis sphaerospora]|eukprot:RKP11035.1 cyclic nucleotide-binding-like protein [Thamnocephalis sphaerospora]
MFNRNRRGSVSAESMHPEDTENEEHIVIPKSDQAKMRIASAVSSNMLFGNLDSDQRRMVVDAMFERRVAANETVIQQGDEGDNFYVVDDGLFEVLVNGKKVVEVEAGGSFGELALMYNTPRAATVTAVVDSILWGVDRVTFRRCVTGHNFRKRKLYESFLKTVPILSKLHPSEVTKLSDALEPANYEEGDYIVEQGDLGNYFYIIEQGEVEVTKVDEDGNELMLPSLSAGDYFGELALIHNTPRAATVMAKNDVRVAALAKDAFVRLLGPVVDIMKRRTISYSTFDRQALEAMLQSIKENSDGESTEDEETHD